MIHYQTLLLNSARMFQVVTTLNIATLLSDPDLEVPLYDCSRILGQDTVYDQI